jgi:intracellular septation protein A
LKQLVVDVLAGWTFLAVLLVTNDIFLATAVALAAGVGQAVWMIWRRQAIDPMQWMAMALVIGLAAATLITRNPTFVVFKPSLLEGGLALMMLRPGWVARYVPPHGRAQAPPGLLVFWGYLWAAVWFAMALSNLVVVRVYGLKAWALYTQVSPFVMLGLLIGAGRLVFRLAIRRAGAALPS